MSRGKLYDFCMLTVKRNLPFSFRLDKKNLPVGVSQLVLFDKAGQVLADRLVFVGKPDTLSLAVRTDKEQYLPYDSIGISFEVNDSQGQPGTNALVGVGPRWPGRSGKQAFDVDGSVADVGNQRVCTPSFLVF